MANSNTPGLNDYWTAIITISLVVVLFLLLRFLQKRG